jgi:hypothetical protein
MIDSERVAQASAESLFAYLVVRGIASSVVPISPLTALGLGITVKNMLCSLLHIALQIQNYCPGASRLLASAGTLGIDHGSLVPR